MNFKMLKVFFIGFLSFCMCACFGGKLFQPPPSMYKTYVKEGASENIVKNAMLECGYLNPEGGKENDINNEVARREICMFGKGFKYRSGYKGMCSLPGKSTLPACQSRQ